MSVIKQYFNILTTPRYSFSKNRYPGSFLENDGLPSQTKPLQSLERRIFCFWTGDNDMSENRQQAVASLREKAEVELILVTPSNLHTFILPDFPLHKGYSYLSAVHKSDYLRCYFMHHHGGGYTDVKAAGGSWKSSFDRLDKRPDKWIAGYREIGKRGVAQVEDPHVAVDLNKNWHLLIGNCAYICRPYTSFTAEWYNELHHKMDTYYAQLIEHPGTILGDNDGYPIPWTSILGQIFHPLCLKYRNKILYANKIKPVLSNYR